MSKKNFNKVPEHILKKIREATNEIVIGTPIIVSKTPNKETLTSFNKILKENWETSEFTYIPSENIWRYSKKNINGYTVVRRDLPKVPKEIYMGERPVFGDWEKWSFTLIQTRDVLQRDFYAPREIPIKIKLIEEKTDSIIYSGIIEYPLDKTSSEEEILFVLNLAQENLWNAIVLADREGSLPEDFDTVLLEWDIFPPEKRDIDLKRLMRWRRNPEIIATVIAERYDFALSLGEILGLKIELVNGWAWMGHYFGVKFTDNLVMFENIYYGNAIYLLFEDWKAMSKLSRTKILSGSAGKYQQIRHSRYWKSEVLRSLKKTIEDTQENNNK